MKSFRYKTSSHVLSGSLVQVKQSFKSHPNKFGCLKVAVIVNLL